MRKIVLLFCAMIMSVNVQADWKKSVTDEWDNVKNKGEELYTNLTKDELSVLPAAQQKAIRSWDNVEDRFNDIIEVKEDKSLAPESAFLKKTKKEYQEDIDDILNDVYGILNDDVIEDARANIEDVDEMIAHLQEKASEHKSKSAILIGSDKKDALEKQQSFEDDIQEYKEKREKLLEDVQYRLSEFGTDLSFEQVEALFVRVNSDDILGMTVIFPVIGEISKSYAKITAASGEDLNNAKKYYSMYVVLLELQLHIQERYIDDLKHTYIPRIDELQKKQQRLIKTTEKEKRQASDKHRSMYVLNLKSQNTTLDAIQLYKTSMQRDLHSMSKAHALLFGDYKLAVNTLNTVTMSSQVSNLINDSNQLFNEIMTMQAPELVPFKNIQMQKEFSALTEKIK